MAVVKSPGNRAFCLAYSCLYATLKLTMHNPRITTKLIKNELLARRANHKIKRVLREHTPATEQPKLKINFYCECSQAGCRQRVPLTLDQYEKLHADKSHFVLAKGHETKKIEKVVKKTSKIEVVEKYALKSD